jgi:hypothetical protein
MIIRSRGDDSGRKADREMVFRSNTRGKQFIAKIPC